MNTQVRFEAPVGKLLESAYREEANWFEREAESTTSDKKYGRKMGRASQYRRVADRINLLTRIAVEAKAPVDAAVKGSKKKAVASK